MPKQPVRFRVDASAELVTAVSGEEADAIMRQPAGSPARRELVSQIALRMTDAINQRDIDLLIDEYHPEIEMNMGIQATGGVWGGDFKETYRGHRELREVAEQWFEPWSELRYELTEVIDLGGSDFIAIGAWHGTGRGSGVEVETQGVARYGLRQGKIAQVDWIPDPESMLRSLGFEP